MALTLGAVRRRVAVTLAGVAVAWLSAAGPVAAHAELVVSDPAPNASIAEAPDAVRLEFTEPVDPATASVELLDARQAAVTGVGRPDVAPDGLSLTAALPALDDGVYVVRYQVLSTVDGHVSGGSFAFLVDGSGSVPPPDVAPTSATPSADLPAALARWVALIGALALAGTAAFWLLSGGPAVRAAGLAARPSVGPWTATVAATVAAIGLVAFLWLAARPLPVPEDAFPLDPAARFGTTPFGIAMRVAVGGTLAAALASLALTLGRLRSATAARIGWAGVLVASVVALAGFSFAGHVAALGGPGFALADLGHLLAVAAWLGALPAFLGLYVLGLRGQDPDTRRAVAGAALRRHSRVALVAVPVVALTGIANAPIVLGSARNLVASDYGNLLLAKVLLFGVAVGIGAANFFLVRRLDLRRLLATIGVETFVAVVAVLTAAGLVTVPAAASRAPRLVTNEVATAHLFGDADGVSVHAVIAVPSPGPQTYQALVGPADGTEELTDIQRVFMTFLPPDGSGLAEQRVRLDAGEIPGLYEATGTYTPVVGEWDVVVTVRRAGVPDEAVRFDLPVSLPLPPERLPPADTGVGVPSPLGFLWRFVPPAPYEWLPPILLFGAAGLLWLLSPPAAARVAGAGRRLAAARTAVVALGVAAAVVVGSQQLVVAANVGGDALLPDVNPVPATEASVAAGAAAYAATCAGCHGDGGRGDGPIAGSLSIRPADLALHVPFHTDAELYAFITRGVSGTPMPGFATELSPEDRWNLVNHLRDRWPER